MQNQLGKLLKAVRKSRSLSQAILAGKAYLSIPTLRLLERGRGNITSWQKALVSLEVELKGRNLPKAASLGKQILALRKRRRIGQRALAISVSTTQPTLIRLEREGQGRVDVLDRVLTVLGAGPVLVPRGETPSFFSHAAMSSAHHGWETPRELLQILYSVFGRFDLDPCSPTSDQRATRVRALIYYTAQDDGLKLPWLGKVFLNPPYGRTIGEWTAKAKSEVAAGNADLVAAILPVRTDTHWWHEDVAGSATVFFLRGRLSFGKGGQSFPFPSALILWGGTPEHVAALKVALPQAWQPGQANVKS